MNFYVSKFVLIFVPVMLIFLAAATLFLGWLAYNLGTQYDASLPFLTMLWIICTFFAAVFFVLWRRVIKLVRQRNNPVISFEADRVTYQTVTEETVSIPLAEIQGVEAENLSPKYGGGHILIVRANLQTDKIFIYNLRASRKDVFLAFKERLPHLLQPYKTIERLIHFA